MKFMNKAIRITVAIMLSAGAGTTGCRARRTLEEEASVSLRKEGTLAQTERTDMLKALDCRDDIVLERPEIVVDDPKRDCSVTIRGERLSRVRDTHTETAQSTVSQNDITDIADTGAVYDRRVMSEGKTTSGWKYIVIAGVIGWCFGRWKKSSGG